MKKDHKTHPGNRIVTLSAVIIIFLGCLYLFYFLNNRHNYEETNDAQVDSYINPVSARAGGFIERVCFTEHQKVNKGDTLVILDNKEYVAHLLSAEAAVEEAYAQLTVLLKGIRSSQLSTRVNADQIQGARARYLLQQQDIERYSILIKEEAVTESDLEQVKSRYEVAASDYSASKNSFATGLAQTDELKSKIAHLNADIRKKEATLELAKLNLSYTIIRAPYSGVLGRKTIMEGQQIQPGQPLVVIVNEHDRWIIANFEETQVAKMFIGQLAEIRIDAAHDKILEGRVVAIAGSTGSKLSILPPDNSTGNFVKIVQRVPVKIAFSEPETVKVLPGMNVNVAIKKR